VVDVLEGLGVVTEAQISLLRGDREYASCLLRKVAVIRASSQSFRTKRDCECRTQLAEEVLRQKRDFCVRVTDITCAVNKKNLVRSTRVHLTFQGALRANMLEIKYQEVLDREKYLKAHDEKVEDCEV
jgi:hypothetical protein